MVTLDLRRKDYGKNEVVKILSEEITKKVDADTIEKIKSAKSKKEALSLLEGTSVELNDEMLAVISGGEDDDLYDDWDLKDWCPSRGCGVFPL